ncbi:MAG: tRNA (N6-isopentenyl adenosine(37)-C2)-methylthiotransferase MiaB [Campylobacterales bacterium]|nr:tRNA (N6-isopentenyl adenosine(37)-C2)-methylthiotransferase MiaB [Campylobacterales bacterium]
MSQKLLYIETLGCAMNVRDSEHIIAELTEKDNYAITNSAKDADLIIINTCSVREKPVQKLFSEIGAFKKIKKESAKIGVCGCTASHLGEEILKKAPAVNFVLGARNVSKIKTAVANDKSVEIDINYDDSSYMFGEYRSDSYKALINISIGCDKECAYCIVPHTRGDEVSVPLELIVKEAQKAADKGAKELILLGQNVNNYGKGFKDKSINFTKLLQEVSKVEGIERIRFTSPHPLHADDEFIEEFAKNPKICKNMHFPLQAGSSKVLKDMRRGYTKEWFLSKAAKIRELCPEATISTDIIVGFPGESDEEFLETMEVVEKVGFEFMFSFAYSSRPLTKAADMPNQIDDEIKKMRLLTLQSAQLKIQEEAHKRQVGKVEKILVEGKDGDMYFGKTGSGYGVKVKSQNDILGQIVEVKITKAGRHALSGDII